ncbi:hypothetical protein E1J61_09410 [Cupriavidus sp. L7L]|nr:hypothetical protein E1J61_09410 [Cupriavidus sp. L7L]
MSALPLQQRPDCLEVNFDGIPASMKDSRPQWVLWRWVKKGNDWTKPPLQANGQYAKPNDPTTWATFEEVRTAYEGGRFDGIGMMLRDGNCGIDLDHVLSIDDSLEPWAQQIVEQFDGAYVEYSPSGDGLHILVKGTLPRCGKSGPDNRLEFYDKGSPRYFTVTGHVFGAAANEVTNKQEAIDWLSKQYTKASAANEVDSNVLPLTQSSNGDLGDEAILARATRAGNSEKFTKLFTYGDWSGYGSQSDADQALANLLAYWTQDADQIDRLFRESALIRSKWDEDHSAGQTYGQMTIAKALSSDSAQKGAQIAALPVSQKSVSGDDFVQAADFMAETASTDWLIDGVLEQGTSCMLFGASGSGKSFIALDWACCVATGTDWHGQAVETAPVFYIVGEGVPGFRRRMRAWARTKGIAGEEMPLHVLKFPVSLSDDDAASDLSQKIARRVPAGQPCMVVIDTLARNFGGDENSNTDVNRLISKIDTHLRIPLNASVVIVHHSGNSEKDRARGASALKAAMDHEYRVERRSGDLRVLQCTKMKDGPEDFEFHFQIEGVSLGDGETAGVLIPLDVPSRNKSETRLAASSVKALGVLRDIADVFGETPDAELQEDVGMFGPALVVHKDKWKPAAIEAGISTGTADSQRKAFERAVKQLIREGRVGNHGDYYWVNT